MKEIKENRSQQHSNSSSSNVNGLLFLSDTDRRIAGVCGGLAHYLEINSAYIRILWIVSIFLGFMGVFVYIFSWLIIPDAPKQKLEVQQKKKSKFTRKKLLLSIISLLVLIAVIASIIYTSSHSLLLFFRLPSFITSHIKLMIYSYSLSKFSKNHHSFLM